MSVLSCSDDVELSEPVSPHSRSTSSLSSYSDSSSYSSSEPSSPSSTCLSRPVLPRVHLTGTTQCCIQETRYAEYLQRRSAMKAISPHSAYPYAAQEEAAVRRVQRSLMSEFEGAEETTEEETSGEETRSDAGSDSEREGSSRSAQIAVKPAVLVPALQLQDDKRAVSVPHNASFSVSTSASTSASVSKSAASTSASSVDSLEKELPLLMDALFADDEESSGERRPRRRINPNSLPPLPPLPVSPQPASLPTLPTASALPPTALSPIALARLSPIATTSSPSTPSTSTSASASPTAASPVVKQPAAKHFIFRSSAASHTTSAVQVSYPALASAARVAITPAPRRPVSASEPPKTPTAAESRTPKPTPTPTSTPTPSSTKSSFFSFGKKAAASVSASSSPTSPTAALIPSPLFATPKSASAPTTAATTPTSASPLSATSSPSAASTPPPIRSVVVRSFYLLTAVDAQMTKPGHTFLCLSLTASATSTPGLQVVEDERVVREIHLASITRCSGDMDDAHVVSVMYATKRAGSGSGSEADTNDRIEFKLASLLDAQQVRTIVNAVIAQGIAAYTATASITPTSSSSPSLTLSPSMSSPSSPSCPSTPTSAPMSPAATPTSSAVSVGSSSCVLKGYLDLHCPGDSETPWQRRFARLYSNRLVLYRTSSSSLPLHVHPLNVSPLSSNRSSVRTNRYQHIVIDADGLVTLRCEAPDDFKRWMNVLTAQLSPSTLPTAAEMEEKECEPSVSSSLSSHSLSSVSAQLGRVMSLAPLLSNQKAFMSYVFELSTLQPFFPSTLPTPAAFVLQTPPTFLRRRHPSLLSVEAELTKYEHLLSSLECLWAESRLVMVDEMEQSGSGQIGFSFPGFDSHVFDVGRLSVVCCGQLLAAPSQSSPHPLTFTQHDFHSAIDSSSPLKEMMTQAAPDLTQMMHSSSTNSRHTAKVLSAQAQRLLLHHCTIASHMKSEWAKWRSGDRISWATMAGVNSSSAKRNERALACYANVDYVWNPSLGALHRAIQGVKSIHQVDALTAAMSLPPVASLTQQNNSVTAGLPGHEAILSPTSSNAGSGANTPNKMSLFGKARGKTNSLDTTVTASPATPLSPSSPVSPSSSAASPASPTSQATTPQAASPMTEVRCLVDAIHLIFLLRTLLHYRRHALSSLHTALLPALAAHSRDQSVAGVLSSLLEAIERERDGVVRVLSVLPSQAEIEREDKRQRRERKDRRRDAEKRRAATEERRREQSLQLQIVQAKQLLHQWGELDQSRSDTTSYYYGDSVTSSALECAADGLMNDALEWSVAELMSE